MNRFSYASLFFCVSLLVVPSSCSVISGLSGEFEHPNPPGSSNTGGAGGGGGAASCNHVVPPPPPPVFDVGGNEDFVLAIRRIDLDEEDQTVRYGFDLDGYCSCTFDPQSCPLPSWVDPKKAICDDNRGLDNGAGIALARLSALSSGAINSVFLNSQIDTGDWSLLFRVRGYGGAPDDDKVELFVYETTGLAAQGMAPAWNGSDPWPVSEQSLVDGVNLDTPVLVDSQAYVRDGVLVANLPNLRMLIRGFGARLDFDLVGVKLAAPIQPDGMGGYRFTEATLGAKWPLPRVFETLSTLRYEGDKRLCKDDLGYIQARLIVCGVVDIYDESTAGGTGGGGTGGGGQASDSCNAISFGMRFDAEPALLGGVTPPAPPPSNPCAAGMDPKEDTCG